MVPIWKAVIEFASTDQIKNVVVCSLSHLLVTRHQPYEQKSLFIIQTNIGLENENKYGNLKGGLNWKFLFFQMNNTVDWSKIPFKFVWYLMSFWNLTDFRQRLLTPFWLQTTMILYGNVVVSYLRKVANAKKFAAYLQKLSTSCLMNFYDI